MIKQAIILTALGWLCAMPIQADTLELDYGSLYSHTRKLDAETMPALQFAFGFAHRQQKRLCNINEAFIHTQKQNIALKVTPENRFTVPSERALKLARAVVNIELDDMADDCDMSVQLETTAEHLKSDYPLHELQSLQRQYMAFFDQMGGFMSFLMPKVRGLNIHFAQQPAQQAKIDGGIALPDISDNQLRLSNQWLEQQHEAELQLPAKPMRIVAWVE